MFVTLKEAMRRLGVTRNTLYQWVDDNEIDYIRLHTGRLRFDVDAYIEKHLNRKEPK